MVTRLRALGAVALLLLLASASAAQEERALTLQNFASDIEIRSDGTLGVVETLQVRFDGEWNGVFRDLSLRHETASGDRERLDIRVSSVADGAGNPLAYEIERPDDHTRRVKAWVPDARDATRTVVIRYTVDNALRFFDAQDTTPAFDELYWNATGDTWEMPIHQALVRVTLPPGAQPRRVAAFTGRRGSTGRDAAIDTAGGTVSVRSTRILEPGEQLTVAVGWPVGAVPRPTTLERTATGVQRFWPLLLPLFAFWGMLSSWRRLGRDPQARPISVQYGPPGGMSPAELGTLIDHRAEMHDVTATVVDLAVRGFVGIEEQTESRLFGLATEIDYIFQLRRPRSEWADLPLHERTFLGAFFPATGDALPSVRLSDLKNRFYKHLPEIRNDIYRALIRRGLYRHRPDGVRGAWMLLGAAVIGAAVTATAIVAESGFAGLHPAAAGVGLALSGLIVMGFGWVMPARTETGARVREQALGFREFLARVETDRLDRMVTGPELFEQYLPHAMAFQVEERWARAFAGLVREPPEWYNGNDPGTFSAPGFADRMGSLSAQAAQTLASSPGSSGSGGGGSAGGGSGGGGGGGF